MVALTMLLFSVGSLADNMLMIRIPMKAEIVLEYVKTSIKEHGYEIAHLQTCDSGLGDFDYKTDFYQVVFFGKVDEVRWISENHPELVSYLPLKIAVIAERDDALLVVLNPEALAPFYAEEAIQVQLGRWNSDLVSIFDDVRRATGKRIAVVD
jgi:uncharacterized protein (DUF302 family)